MKKILILIVLLTVSCGVPTFEEAAEGASRQVTFFFHDGTSTCFAKYASSISNISCTAAVLARCNNYKGQLEDQMGH